VPYGIAHKGIIDQNGETHPIAITTDNRYENPQIKEGSEMRPVAGEIQLTVTVSKLQPGVQYNLYKYNDETMVPSSEFNANSMGAVSVLQITSFSDHYTFTETIKSIEKVFYRCVAANDGI